MKSAQARRLLAKIRRLDKRIIGAQGRARRRLLNRRVDLIIRYIAALAIGVVAAFWRNAGGGK